MGDSNRTIVHVIGRDAATRPSFSQLPAIFLPPPGCFPHEGDTPPSPSCRSTFAAPRPSTTLSKPRRGPARPAGALPGGWPPRRRLFPHTHGAVGVGFWYIPGPGEDRAAAKIITSTIALPSISRCRHPVERRIV
jgi:hypothetical protein